MKVGIRTFENGIYRGMIENELPEGVGMMVYKDGTKFTGFWHEGKRSGRGMLYSDDEVIFSGIWENDNESSENEKDNVKTIIHEDGKVVKCQSKDDVLCGIGEISVKKSEFLYIGEIENEKANGSGVLYNGSFVYGGGFTDGVPEGKGVQMLPSVDDTFYTNGNYDMDDRLEGKWENGKKKGPFVHRMGGMPYDEYYSQDGIKSENWLDYSVSSSEHVVEPNSIRCIYGGHSAFMIETPTSTLLFDWYRSVVPPIRMDKPLYILISHIHRDHFNIGVMRLADYFPQTEIYIGYGREFSGVNYALEKLSDKVKDTISHFDGAQRLCTDFGEVRSLCSTDMGVGFIVDVDGMTLYHAGDLTWFGQEDDSELRKFTEPLKGKTLHYAMLPLDPRFGDHGAKAVDYYHNLCNILMFTPIHLWENYDYIEKFAEEYPQYCPKMLAVNTKGVKMANSIEINKPYIIKFV